MHLRMIRTIFRKDLLDAIRDARVLVALIVPLGLGLLYGQIFQDEVEVPSASVAYTSVDETMLPEAIGMALGPRVELTFTEFDSPDAVRQQIDGKDADVGLVVPAGFDAAVAAGQMPTLTVIHRDTPGYGSSIVLGALDGALRQMAGQQPPAQIDRDVLATESLSAQSIFDKVGLRPYFLLAVVVMLIAMVAMLAVPVILSEEREKKTLDALVMVASYADVIVAKALVGLAYVAASVTILLAITRLVPSNPAMFVGAIFLFSLVLIGFGLLIGGLFRNANQVNTWSGFLMMPVIAPAFIVGLDLPRAVQVILDVLPTSQASKLLINGLTGEALFANAWLSFLVLAVWVVIAYAALLFTLSRQRA